MSHESSESAAVGTVVETQAYQSLIDRLTRRIGQSQSRAARAVNTELVMLYWAIGRDILEQQREHGWGDDVVGRISQDLRAATQGARGFSRRGLFYMRRFAALWSVSEKVPPVVAQIGWSLHRVLFDTFGDQPDLYAWYASKAAEHRWSKRHLQAQINLRLHERQGAALTNFAEALDADDAQDALAATKDPYVLDFLELEDGAKERELEQAILDDIQGFLLELGHGFALYGRQTALLVGGEEFFVDLLFYHHKLRRFVVIDLKIGEFKAEHAGKMNFYLNVIDEQLRHDDDRESVGMILCAGRNETVGTLALHRVLSPIAVSTWQSGTASPGQPRVEADGEDPEDLGELAELDDVRAQLTERITRQASSAQKEPADEPAG